CCAILDAMRTAFLLLVLSTALAFAQQPESDGLFSSAIQAQQRGDNQTAILDYQKLLKLHPNMIEARANLGAALAREGRFDEAIAQYHLALSFAPDNDQIRMNMAIAYYKKSDLEDARREFEEVRKTQPKNPQLAILLGDSEVRLGQPAAAAAMLAPLEADNAANPDFEYVLGTALIQSGSRREGAERLDKVAERTHSADAYLLAGSTFMDLNEFARARTDLEAALRLNPNLPRIYALTGMARDMNGDAAAAEPAFREALKRNPNDFDANLYLGSILYKRRDMAEAKPYLDRAIQLKPDSATARYELAMWESTSGQYDDAAKDLEALEKSNPDWLQPHVELANVYYRLHRPADGAKERAIVAKLNAQQQSEGPPKLQQP
ncbi:MAG: tetratricopeptide repeat protein, partial [Silvibacterium sp.]